MSSTQLSLAGVAPKLTGEWSQWFTPRDLAARIVAWAGVHPGQRVLEPSAGDGSFVTPLLDAGATVTAVDIDRANVSQLVGMRGRRHFDLRCFNFLMLDDIGAHDVAVMNPPYEDGQDLAHVLHALTFAPRVVALLRLVFLAGLERHRELWSKHSLTRVAILSGRPAFGGPCTESGAKSDFAVFEILRGRRSVPSIASVEWWA